MARRIHNLLLLVLFLTVAGCSSNEAKIALRILALIPIAVGIFLLLALLGWIADFFDRREKVRQHRLNEDYEKRLRAYPRSARDLANYLPDCRHILLAEAIHDRAYEIRSACHRARKKTLGLINAATHDLKRKFDEDLDRKSYSSMQELIRISDACSSCAERNKGKPFGECQALDDKNLPVDVDLVFDVSGED